jgi:hypothetical protein
LNIREQGQLDPVVAALNLGLGFSGNFEDKDADEEEGLSCTLRPVQTCATVLRNGGIHIKYGKPDFNSVHPRRVSAITTASCIKSSKI